MFGDVWKRCYEPPHDISNKMTVRPGWSESSLWTPRLIRVFAVRSMGSEGPKLSSCGQRRLRSDWADAQADLSLRWALMPFCWFCHILHSSPTMLQHWNGRLEYQVYYHIRLIYHQMRNGIFCPRKVEKSIFHSRGVRYSFYFYFLLQYLENIRLCYNRRYSYSVLMATPHCILFSAHVWDLISKQPFGSTCMLKHIWVFA